MIISWWNYPHNENENIFVKYLANDGVDDIAQYWIKLEKNNG